MPTHFTMESIAARLAAGTYSTCVVRGLAKAPSSPVTELPPSPWAIVAPYLGSALLGAVLALAFMVQP